MHLTSRQIGNPGGSPSLIWYYKQPVACAGGPKEKRRPVLCSGLRVARLGNAGEEKSVNYLVGRGKQAGYSDIDNCSLYVVFVGVGGDDVALGLIQRQELGAGCSSVPTIGRRRSMFKDD